MTWREVSISPYATVDLSSQALRVDAIAKIAESEGAQLLHQLNGTAAQLSFSRFVPETS